MKKMPQTHTHTDAHWKVDYDKHNQYGICHNGKKYGNSKHKTFTCDKWIISFCWKYPEHMNESKTKKKR